MSAEGGGSHGDFMAGGGARGAFDPEFTNHMFIKASAIRGEGSNYGGSSLNAGGGGVTGTGGGHHGGGGGGTDPLKQLADIAVGGIEQSLLPQGFIDYTQNSWFKSAGAALGMLGGMLGLGGGGAGGGGGLTGMLSGLTGGNLDPAKMILAEQNPERAAQLGWTQQPGAGAPLGRAGRQSPGQLMTQEAHGNWNGAGGPNFYINGGAMISDGAAKEINGAVNDKGIANTRAGKGPTYTPTRQAGQSA